MFTVRGGQVVRMAPYVDMLDTLRQLGARRRRARARPNIAMQRSRLSAGR